MKTLLKYQFLKRDWIQVAAAGYKMQLSRVPATGYKLRQTLDSWGWLEFQRLDTSCDWLRPTIDLSFDCLIRVTADSILQLTRVPAAGYNLRLIPSCGWLWVAADSSSSIRVTADSILRLTTSWGWFYPAADSSSAGWTRLAADLYFNISNKFKDLFCKIHHFYGLFSTAWFLLPLIQALAAGSNLEEAWRSLRKFEEAPRL